MNKQVCQGDRLLTHIPFSLCARVCQEPVPLTHTGKNPWSLILQGFYRICLVETRRIELLTS